MFGSFPVCYMLITSVEILLHNISIIMNVGGTVCERTRLKWLPSCRFSSVLPFQNFPTFVSSRLIIISKCLSRLKIKYLVYDHMDTQLHPSNLVWTWFYSKTNGSCVGPQWYHPGVCNAEFDSYINKVKLYCETRLFMALNNTWKLHSRLVSFVFDLWILLWVLSVFNL